MAVVPRVKPVFRKPGAALTKEELQQAEEYFEHHQGVVIQGTDWSPDDLDDPDEDSVSDRAAVQ